MSRERKRHFISPEWIERYAEWMVEDSNEPEGAKDFALIIIGDTARLHPAELTNYYLEIKKLFSPSTHTPLTNSLQKYLPALSAVIADRLVTPPDDELPLPLYYIQKYVKD